MTSSIKAESGPDNRKRWEIKWYPWLHAFHVTHYPGAGEGPRSGWVSQNQCGYWEECERGAAS